jgi:4-hydroxy-tetrahydrodipicolinate synthase
MDQFDIDMGSWFTCFPGRPDYFTHWGGAFKYAASVLGLPIGAHPHSRPPQARLPEAAKTQIRSAYRRLGLIGQ